MIEHGFFRVACAVPSLRIADCRHNAQATLTLWRQAEQRGGQLVVAPELGLTGYTCGDLFHQHPLLTAALDALRFLRDATRSELSGLAIVGLPIVLDDQVFNCAAVLHRGRVLGVVPKSYLPNYKEFYEDRWFAPARLAVQRELRIDGERVPFGTDLLFEAENVEGLRIGVEICEDAWTPIPPSCWQALHGATVLVNLSASNELIGKAAYRRQLVANQSARCLAAYLYCAAGVGESTTDLVYGGHCLIAESGNLLAESPRFRREPTLLLADIDWQRLQADRLRQGSFADVREQAGQLTFRRVGWEVSLSASASTLERFVDAHPFVPRESATLRDRCEEIFQTQVAALAGRWQAVRPPRLVIGVSGGLDSTLALLVACKTADLLHQPRSLILGLTMPGFGTTGRTLVNSRELMRLLAITSREIDIRALCLDEMRALGHRPFGIDLTDLTSEAFTERLHALPPDNRSDLVFENVQARCRTALLMNSGFVIGTGDLSELALGWCTYNGDHMSMYGVNVGVPKTLVKFLVDWAARNEFDGDVRRVLLDVVATDISPELLPVSAQGESQSTESSIGPYELHDFFLYHVLRFGFGPAKLLFLARHARFDRPYSLDELRHWLGVFLRRFFANQFKRSCLPDGPKIGTVCLSPRGDWRMPSDATAAEWLRELGVE